MRHIDLTLLDPAQEPLKQWIIDTHEALKTLKSKATALERKNFIKANPLWKYIKNHLFDIYGNKCWYSECDLAGGDGDVDHFRPKGRSRGINGKKILPDGYWWLAYEYTNYRISCIYCNRGRENKRAGKTQGKLDWFPLVDGATPLTINDDVSIEKYILLDPTNKDDVNLLSFDETGSAVPLTSNKVNEQRVIQSISIYHLGDHRFEINRKNVWRDCVNDLKTFSTGFSLANEELINMGRDSLKNKVDIKTPYSATAIECIKLYSEGETWRDALLQGLDIAK